MNKHSCTALAVTLFVAGTLASPSVSAAKVARETLVHAPGSCVPFAPTGNVRYTSVGVRNAGTSTFYISCSVLADWDNGLEDAGAYRVYLSLANNAADDVTVNCTLRPGYAISASTTSGGAFPRSTVVSAGSSSAIEWIASTVYQSEDFKFGTPNITCTLPVGAELRYIYITGDEEVGALEI